MTMKPMVLGVVAVAALGLAAVPALAKGGMWGGAMPTFASLDTDADGKITADELNAAHAARLAAMDADKDGFLTAAELIAARMGAKMDPAAMPAPMAEKITAKVQGMLNPMDADKDGKVSLSEFQAPNGKGGHEQMIAKVDTDGDSAISQAEFDAMAARMAARGDRGGKDGKRGKDRNGGWGGKHGHHHGQGFGPGRGMMPVPAVPGDLAPPPAVGVQPFPVPMR